MIVTRPPVPERALSVSEIRAVARALVEAWRRLPTEHLDGFAPFDPSLYMDEDQVTIRLVEILNELLDSNTVRGFSDEFFQDVIRDGKVVGYAAKRKDMMPDMRFGIRFKPAHLTSVRSELAFLAEAKVFEGNRNLRLYFAEGIQRFVDGNYARKTDIGMMVVYCTDEFAWPFPASLGKYLKKKYKCVKAANGIGGLFPLKPVTGVPWGFTKHRRNFDPSSPHIFELHHLWLNVPTP